MSDMFERFAEYAEKKKIERDENYADRMIRKFLRLLDLGTLELLQYAKSDEKLDAQWFDNVFPSCPFRLAFLKTQRTITLDDFFWKPVNSELWQVYTEARDNYRGSANMLAEEFNRVALIYPDNAHRHDMVLREHHDALGSLPVGYPRASRLIRGTTYVIEPLEGFCEILRPIWKP